MDTISWTEHNNYYKLNSAGNDWRRKSPDTDTKKETNDKDKGTNRDTKEMERTCAVICTSIFTVFHFTHYLALFVLHFTGLMQTNQEAGPKGNRRRKEIDKGN